MSGRRCRHFCGKKNFRGTDFIPTTKKEPEDQVMLDRERVCISKLGDFFFCKAERLNFCLYLCICVILCAFEHNFMF